MMHRTDHEQVIEQRLTDAKIAFRRENAYENQFHGSRYIFSRRDWAKAEKALGKEYYTSAYFKKEACTQVF